MPQSQRLPIMKLLLSLAVPLMLTNTLAWADDACEQNGVILPGCNYVTSTPLTGAGGYALYCPPQEPYHWTGYWSKTVSNNYSSSDFTVTENVLNETLQKPWQGYGDYTYFQWFGTFDDPPATVTITQGCSPIDPNGNCTNSNGICQRDPGCTISSAKVLTCIGAEDSESCFTEWGEQCVSGDAFPGPL